MLVRLVGLYVFFDRIISLVGSFRGGELKTYMAPGLISAVIGGVLIFWPDVTGRLLLLIVGLWAVLKGATHLWARHEADANDPERILAMSRVIRIVH